MASVGCRCSSAAAKPICTMPGSLLAETPVTGGRARGTLGSTMTTPAPPPVPAAASAPELDVLLTGTVFFDLIFTGFPHPPTPGTEVWTSGMGSSPGGIANLAVACARLGLRPGPAARSGDGLAGA